MTSGWRTRFESGRRWSPISNSRDCFPRNSVCSHDPDYVARDEAELLDLTQRSSAVTHNHSDAITDGIAEVMFGLPDDIAEIEGGYLARYLFEGRDRFYAQLAPAFVRATQQAMGRCRTTDTLPTSRPAPLVSGYANRPVIALTDSLASLGIDRVGCQRPKARNGLTESLSAIRSRSIGRAKWVLPATRPLGWSNNLPRSSALAAVDFCGFSARRDMVS